MAGGMLKSSPRERIQRSYRGRLLSMVGSRGMFSSRKRWCCATGVKLATCLVRIALWLHPPEDSGMSFAEQSDATVGGAAPVQQESSVEIQPSAESQQTSSPISEGAEEGDSSGEDGSGSGSDSGSTSESDDEDEPDLEPSARPNVPSEDSPDLPSRENLPVIQGARADQGQGSQKQRADTPSEGEKTITKPTQVTEPTQMRTLKSLFDFDEEEIFPKWYRKRETSVLTEALKVLGIKTNFNGFVEVVHAAADLIHAARCGESHYADNPNGPR